MKLIIDGREYDGGLQPFIGDLRLLKKEFGFGYGTVIERLRQLDDEADMTQLLDDGDFVDALLAWMWMIRLRAGERTVTLAEVGMTPLDQLRMIADDDEAGEIEADPTRASDPAATGQADANPTAKPARTTGSTRTSSKRSTRASH